MTEKCYIHTFGCQMNKHDSERIAGFLMKKGLSITENQNDATVVLLNTCYVREKAMSKVYGHIGRLQVLKKENPDMIIGVCGCGAQGEGKALFKRMPGIDLIAGPQEIAKLPTLIEKTRLGYSKLSALGMTDHPFPLNSLEPMIRDNSIKAWITVIEGCNNFCSYCIVPFVRGSERSRSAIDILHEIQGLVLKNYKEVTLLGQNVNSYISPDNDKMDFPDLLAFLSKESGIPRIRFITSHPKDLSDKLISVIAEYKPICEYLHLPVQSGSNKILKAMNRGYTLEHYKNLIQKLKSAIPDIALTTDIIVGFPGETEYDFQQTSELLQWAAYKSSFIFHYQVRKGTKASELVDTIPFKEKLNRLKKLVDLQKHFSDLHQNKLLGQTVEILVEEKSKRGENFVMGRTRANDIVHYSGNETDIGKFVQVKIKEVFAHSSRGKKIEML